VVCYSPESYAVIVLIITRHFWDHQELRMDDLRRRLEFHSLKIRLVIDRLSITLLTDADSKLDSILAIVNENLQLSRDALDEIRLVRHHLFGGEPGRRPPMTQTLLDVSPPIASRFRRALDINAPNTYRAHLPLAESFDALYYRFGECVKGQSQTSENRLKLLKCCWFLRQIQESSEYLEASPVFYYRRAITQVDIALRTRIRRFASVGPYEEAPLLALPDALYEIWLPPAAPQTVISMPAQPNPLSEQGMERQLVSIELAAVDRRAPDVVHVFQQSQDNYRIALETSTTTGERYISGQSVYTREHRLIPRYALPTMPEPIPEVAIFAHNQCQFYRFQGFEDAWRFQSAFTGFEVSHDQPAVKCQFGPNLDSFVCDGRVQLWQDPIDFKGPSQGYGLEKTVSSAKSKKASIAPSLAHTTNYTFTKDAIIAENVKYSAMVIYTQMPHPKHGDRFAIIVLELRETVFIDREACACKHGYDKCSKLVIATNKKARLPLRIIFSSGQDPNSFDVLPLRLPRRPDFANIKIRESEHIVLKFQDLDSKQTFDNELQNRFTVRDAQRKHMLQTEQEFKGWADRPGQKEKYLNQQQLKRQSTMDSLSPAVSKLGPAPRIASPEMGPSLGVAFAHGTDPRPIRGLGRTSEPISLSTSPLSNDSSLGSRSAGSRTTSTSNTEISRSPAPVVSSTGTLGRMTELLNTYHIDDGFGAQRSQNQSSWSQTARSTSSQLPNHTTSVNNLASPTQSTFSSSRARPETERIMMGSYAPNRETAAVTVGSVGRRDTSITIQSSTTNSSSTTAQSPERQDSGRRGTGRSGANSGIRGFFKHMAENR
jgi:hypothetical protein